jgi:hypothetical protein
MPLKCCPLALLLLCCGASSLNAEFTKKGQVGFRFLENPVSAEVVGRGGTGVVNTFTSNAVFWNPALLGWVPNDLDVGLNHTRGIADINYNAVAASIHLWSTGVLGLSLLAMDYGTFYTTVRAANEQGFVETGTFSPSAFSLGAAFSQRVSDRFSYGVHLKYARQDLGAAWVATAGTSLSDSALALAQKNYDLDVLAIDVGAYYDFLHNGIRFGAVVQNISRELTYESQQFPLPFAVVFGLAIEPLRFFDIDSVHSLVLCVESRHPRDFGEKVELGLEYYYLNTFALRGGYRTNYDERGWTAGVGVKYAFAGIPWRIDYAYEPFGVLGTRHFISLGVGY